MHETQAGSPTESIYRDIKKGRQTRRLLTYGLELLLILAFALVAPFIGVEFPEILAHAFFAVSTMSLVNCVEACRGIKERCHFIQHVLSHGQKAGVALPAWYEFLREYSDEKRGWFEFVTAGSVLFWLASALFYSKLVADGAHNVYFQAPLGLCAGIGFFLAYWKLDDVLTVPEQLELPTILAMFCPVKQTGPARPASHSNKPKPKSK